MVPCDFKMAGLLTDDKLRTTIRFGAGSSLMFFFDCCHSGTILDLPYTLRHTLSGPEYPIETEAGAIFCISASKDDQSAYETAEGGVCTRAFLGAYTPSVSPAATLRLMRRYAERKGMPQTIMMASNRPFTEADASFVEAEPEGGGGFCAAFHRCQNRLGCSKGRSKAGSGGGERERESEGEREGAGWGRRRGDARAGPRFVRESDAPGPSRRLWRREPSGAESRAEQRGSIWARAQAPSQLPRPALDHEGARLRRRSPCEAGGAPSVGPERQGGDRLCPRRVRGHR